MIRITELRDPKNGICANFPYIGRYEFLSHGMKVFGTHAKFMVIVNYIDQLFECRIVARPKVTKRKARFLPFSLSAGNVYSIKTER